MQQTPANWYVDPQNPSLLRYWDGQQWTEHTAANPAAAPPPPPSAPWGAPTGVNLTALQVVEKKARRRWWLWLGAAAFALLGGAGLVDLTMRNSIAAELAKEIEVAEEVLIAHQEELARLVQQHDVNTEEGLTSFTQSFTQEAGRSGDEYAAAVEKVASISIPSWHRGATEAQRVYLEHAGYWNRYMELASEGDVAGALSDELGNSISETWYAYCDASLGAVPYYDFSGIERTLKYTNERGGCYDEPMSETT